MTNIVKITPTEKAFSISWIPHIRCNYNCMYCPDERHDNTTSFPELSAMKSNWEQIYNKTKHLNLQYKINWSGGEPSLWRDFSPFITWLKENYSNVIHQMGVCSNGSASAKYYEKLFANLDYLSFSTHTEHMNETKFFNTAKVIQRIARETNKSFMINIMEEYWDVETSKRLIDICKENNINFNVSRIIYNRPGSRTYPIFKFNKELSAQDVSKEIVEEVDQNIKDYLNVSSLSLTEDKNYNARVEFDDGRTVNVFASKLNFLELHKFTGWHCYAGSNRIFILPDTSVWSGECQNDLLGYLKDSSFQIKQEPVVCHKDKCSNNPDDIMTTKYAV